MLLEKSYGGIIHEVQMEPKELEYVKNLIKNLPEGSSMVEWGSGGSTLVWIESKHESVSLQSIEHNPVWFHRTTRAIKAHFGEVPNFRYDFVKEEYGFEHGYATILEEHPFGLKDYINAPVNKDADVFFIDGIARASCALSILARHPYMKKHSPVILIHDYVGREEWYDWIAPLFDNIEIVGEKLARFHL